MEKNYQSSNLKFIFILPLFILSFFIFAGKANAAVLKLSPVTVQATTGDTFDVDVNVDSQGEQILAIDSYILYDTNNLQAIKVTDGSFFPTVFNNLFTGKVYIAGIVNDPATYKSGSGKVATITFKTLKDATGTLTFYCVDGVSDSSKVIKNDVNSTNIINCSQNGKSNYTIGSGSSSGGNNGSPPGGIVATPTGTVTNTTPATLPQTGFMDNIFKYGVPGAVLFIIGVGAKMML